MTWTNSTFLALNPSPNRSKIWTLVQINWKFWNILFFHTTLESSSFLKFWQKKQKHPSGFIIKCLPHSIPFSFAGMNSLYVTSHSFLSLFITDMQNINARFISRLLLPFYIKTSTPVFYQHFYAPTVFISDIIKTKDSKKN